jgi:phospholipid-translocating ATPase
MLFRKVVTKSSQFNSETLDLLETQLQESLFQNDTVSWNDQASGSMLRNFLTCLMIAHNVTPTVENGQRELQCSSPDELCLVKFGESLGYKLTHRTSTEISITNPTGATETYEILDNFPFTSDRKRMGIIVKDKLTSQILFWLKGADIIMKDKVNISDKDFLIQESETLASNGLRTLVFAQKILTTEVYQEMKQMLDLAAQDLAYRDQIEESVISNYESDMEFLGITGVEDLLQEDVKSVIESLRKGGINIWMLTGDKLETAKCISISTGLKSPGQEFYQLEDFSNAQELVLRLDEYARRPEDVIIIEGATLGKIFTSPELRAKFLEVAARAPSVICCRCAPAQKAEITVGLKKILKFGVCAIGDGGNDVRMIQSANVGIGIEGKEGKQAALASDFSITKFNTILKLTLWHGRLAYMRTALLTNFIFHRGLIVS